MRRRSAMALLALGAVGVLAYSGTGAARERSAPLSAVAQQAPPEGQRETGRLAGTDRFGTAVAISRHAFPDGASTAYLARADVAADAVAGGSLTDGPILLTPACTGGPRDKLPLSVGAELARLDPDRVMALGGTKAVCDDVLSSAARMGPEPQFQWNSDPFPLSALTGPPENAEDADTPAAAALREFLSGPEGEGFGASEVGWRLLSEREDQVTFAQVDPAIDLLQPVRDRTSPGVDVRVERQNGDWEAVSWGDFWPTRVRPSGAAASWRVVDGIDVDDSTVEVAVEVTEQGCTGGRSSEGRLLDPLIEEFADVVVVTYAVQPRPEGVNGCPSNPPTATTLRLPEPLAGRTLVDGTSLPYRDATTPDS